MEANSLKKLTIEASSTTLIHSDIIAMGINKTIFATGDDLRPVMSGVFANLVIQA